MSLSGPNAKSTEWWYCRHFFMRLRSGLYTGQRSKKLHTYMMRQLRDITDIKWYDKITNDGILSRAHLLWIDGVLIEKNLGWLGHVQRMYSQLCDEKRNQGRPRLRFKDVVKRNMRHRQINLKSWQTMAGSRAAWSFVIKPKPWGSLSRVDWLQERAFCDTRKPQSDLGSTSLYLFLAY